MTPERCIWEHLPTFWLPREAWALFDGNWVSVDSEDVFRNGWVLSEEKLDAKFGNLPPLPEEAFRQYRADSNVSD